MVGVFYYYFFHSSIREKIFLLIFHFSFICFYSNLMHSNSWIRDRVKEYRIEKEEVKVER